MINYVTIENKDIVFLRQDQVDIMLQEKGAEIAALKARIADLEKAAQWQPIETAPMDGTEVLLYGTYQWEHYIEGQRTGAVVGSRGGVGVFKSKTDDSNWIASNANPYEDYIQPTHWMPLPQPPKENE